MDVFLENSAHLKLQFVLLKLGIHFLWEIPRGVYCQHIRISSKYLIKRILKNKVFLYSVLFRLLSVYFIEKICLIEQFYSHLMSGHLL